MVISVVPGWFWMPITTISPSRTRRRLTMPSMGETMEVFESMSSARVLLRARLRDAPAGGVGVCARAIDRGARRGDLRAVAIGRGAARSRTPRPAISACSKQVALAARAAARLARARLGGGQSAVGAADLLGARRAPRLRARAPARAAPDASLCACTASMRASTWPALTRSPSRPAG